jgi:hypothetical protein
VASAFQLLKGSLLPLASGARTLPRACANVKLSVSMNCKLIDLTRDLYGHRGIELVKDHNS